MSETRKTFGKRFVFTIALDILTVLIVLWIFNIASDRLLAARMAATSFLISGLFICVWTNPWWLGRLTSTWVLHVAFVIVFSAPMAIFRLFSQAPFSDLNWLGMPGPILHETSSKFYPFLLVGPIIDLAIIGVRKFLAKKSPESPRGV